MIDEVDVKEDGPKVDEAQQEEADEKAKEVER